MYDNNFECTYHTVEHSKQDDEYRNNLLKIFQLTEFNDEQINKEIHKLFLQIKESNLMVECMRKAASIMLSEDELIGFMVLFSFDFLHLTIPCIHNILRDCPEKYNKEISDLNKKLST